MSRCRCDLTGVQYIAFSIGQFELIEINIVVDDGVM